MNLLPALHEILARLHINGDPAAFAGVFTLLMARAGAALPFVPFLGGRGVPGNVRTGLAVLIAIVLYPSTPSAMPNGSTPGFLTYVHLALLLKELMVGAVIGLMVQIVFVAMETAGALLEFTAGTKMGEVLAPQVSSATGPLSVLFGHAAIVIYMGAGIHLLFLRSLAATYQAIPLFSYPEFRVGFLPLAEKAGAISAGFLAVAFQIGAPSILLLALIRVGSNLVFRTSFAAIQSDHFQPLSTVALLGALFLGAGLIGEETVRLGAGYLDQLRGFFTALR